MERAAEPYALRATACLQRLNVGNTPVSRGGSFAALAVLHVIASFYWRLRTPPTDIPRSSPIAISNHSAIFRFYRLLNHRLSLYHLTRQRQTACRHRRVSPTGISTLAYGPNAATPPTFFGIEHKAPTCTTLLVLLLLLLLLLLLMLLLLLLLRCCC